MAVFTAVLVVGYLLFDVPGWVEWFFLLFIAAGLPAVIMWLTLQSASIGRRDALRALAAEHGWTLTTPGSIVAAVFTGHRPVQRLQITDRWSWPPFGKANLGVVIDHLTGEFAGYEFAELTYAYTGRRAGQSVIGVTVVGLPVGLPPLQVGPDSRATFPIPGLLSYDLNLRNETFNRPLRVQAQDLRYATDMLNPRAVEALLTVEPFIWRIDGCDLIAFSQPLRDPAQILRRLEVLTTITAYIPSFVLDDHGTDSCHCIPNEHGHHRP